MPPSRIPGLKCFPLTIRPPLGSPMRLSRLSRLRARTPRTENRGRRGSPKRNPNAGRKPPASKRTPAPAGIYSPACSQALCLERVFIAPVLVSRARRQRQGRVVSLTTRGPYARNIGLKTGEACRDEEFCCLKPLRERQERAPFCGGERNDGKDLRSPSPCWG